MVNINYLEREFPCRALDFMLMSFLLALAGVIVWLGCPEAHELIPALMVTCIFCLSMMMENLISEDTYGKKHVIAGLILLAVGVIMLIIVACLESVSTMGAMKWVFGFMLIAPGVYFLIIGFTTRVLSSPHEDGG